MKPGSDRHVPILFRFWGLLIRCLCLACALFVFVPVISDGTGPIWRSDKHHHRSLNPFYPHPSVCQLQRHFQLTVIAPNRFGNLFQLPINPKAACGVPHTSASGAAHPATPSRFHPASGPFQGPLCTEGPWGSSAGPTRRREGGWAPLKKGGAVLGRAGSDEHVLRTTLTTACTGQSQLNRP